MEYTGGFWNRMRFGEHGLHGWTDLHECDDYTAYAEELTSLNVSGGPGIEISGVLNFSCLALHWR